MVEDPQAAYRWQMHGEQTIYDNPWVRLVQVDATSPAGERFGHHAVRLQTVASALVLDGRGRVLMLWRHRFIPDEFGWELPTGIVAAGETGPETALREAEEETGWRPTGPPEHLITFQPMPGMVDTPHELYLFHGAAYIGEPSDPEEAGRVDWIKINDIPGLIERGEVSGAASLVGLLHFLALGGTQR